jgi:hypothetical protein
VPLHRQPNLECVQCEKGNRYLEHVDTGHRPVASVGPDLEIELIAIYRCEKCGRIQTEPIRKDPTEPPARDEPENPRHKRSR